MQEPMKTSSIFSRPISESVLASSGSFGQQRMGSVRLARSISKTLRYCASLSASMRTGLANYSSMAAMRLFSVRTSP